MTIQAIGCTPVSPDESTPGGKSGMNLVFGVGNGVGT